MPNTVFSEKHHFFKTALKPFSRKMAFFFIIACRTGPKFLYKKKGGGISAKSLFPQNLVCPNYFPTL